MRKSVDLLLFASLDSNAILVLQSKWNIYMQYYIKHAVNCLFSTFGASKHLCLLFCILIHNNKKMHRLTQFSIMLLDMSLMRLSRCLANSSSGQCRSLMKVWRASSFQKRSSDAPEPLLPTTQTHTHVHTQVRRARSPGWREEGQSVGGKGGGVVAGAEEDAVPLHLNTVKFTLTIYWLVRESQFLFVQVFLTVSVWVEGASRVYCHKSITMLQSMIIDWDVKWPHADKVTADTAANHTVKTKDKGMEKWGRACKHGIYGPSLFLQK